VQYIQGDKKSAGNNLCGYKKSTITFYRADLLSICTFPTISVCNKAWHKTAGNISELMFHYVQA